MPEELNTLGAVMVFGIWTIIVVVLISRNNTYGARKQKKMDKKYQKNARRIEKANNKAKPYYGQRGDAPDHCQAGHFQEEAIPKNAYHDDNKRIPAANGNEHPPADDHLDNIRKVKKLSSSTVLSIDNMRGREFEVYLEGQFTKMGYEVVLTPESYDYGADLIVQKDGVKTAIQCKQYGHKSEKYKGILAGIESVQQAAAAVAYYEADHSLVITSSYFTESAISLARANHTELWDRSRIIQEFGLEKDPGMGLEKHLYSTFCPRCGSYLVRKMGRWGSFIGCSTYPKCSYSRDRDQD